MFFNQLVNNAGNEAGALNSLIKKSISEPNNLSDALNKIEDLDKYCSSIFMKAKDRRKVANPGSICYFLSYFWQIHDPQKWPILYTSLSNAYTELSIWEDQSSPKETYSYFFKLNEEIKGELSKYTKKEITNWDIEHALWRFTGGQVFAPAIKPKATEIPEATNAIIQTNESFKLSDYLIPKVANLVELGAQIDKSAAAKGSVYEKLVSEIFKQLEFHVEVLGQGSGRNPDAILRLREENTAFIVDAKAYSNGYSLGVDDRAIKEYINHYCPLLKKEGYKKIGFIIVSNSFKSNFDNFINEVTWTTDIKRFILLTSEALLYLLAYRTKDQFNISTIIESIIGFSNPVTSQTIIEKFDDV